MFLPSRKIPFFSIRRRESVRQGGNVEAYALREQVIEQIKKTFHLPPVTGKVLSLLSRPDVDFAELKRVVEHEPSLTSNVLRLANSVYARRAGEIATVHDALLRLGTNVVYQMALAASFNPLMKKTARSYDMPPDVLWKHSVAVAVTAEEISSRTGVEEPLHTFTAGLLHDVGKIVLGSCLEIDPQPILGVALRERVSIDIAEQMVLGIDHAEGGAILLESWNLPSSVVEAVRWHHQPDSPSVKNQVLVDLIHVANALCYVCSIGVVGLKLKLCPSCDSVRRTRLTTDIALRASESAKERVDSLLPIFTGKRE
ncbi:MAG: HDOD domain-containing protein [Deltaproteobacteria bacterium]|nr:MAG: HDOD domain-containing protein [Deltaproteobacteria bacterium]